jgi:hypothetical protein
MEVPMSKLSFQSALITAVAIAGFAVGRLYPWPASQRADDRAYYVKSLEYSLEECMANLKAMGGEH